MASGLLCRGGSEAQLTVRTVLAGAWRVGLTQGVPEFVADPKGARVLWLYGHVGAGAAKSGLVGVALDSMASDVGAGAAKNGLVGVALDSMASGLLCRGGSEAQLTVRTVLAGAWRVRLTQRVPEFVADPKGAKVSSRHHMHELVSLPNAQPVICAMASRVEAASNVQL